MLAPVRPGDATVAELVGEQLRLAVERVDTADLPPERWITTSVGDATGPPDTPLIRMIERADLALYRAKRLGKNRVEVAGA